MKDRNSNGSSIFIPDEYIPNEFVPDEFIIEEFILANPSVFENLPRDLYFFLFHLLSNKTLHTLCQVDKRFQFYSQEILKNFHTFFNYNKEALTKKIDFPGAYDQIIHLTSTPSTFLVSSTKLARITLFDFGSNQIILDHTFDLSNISGFYLLPNEKEILFSQQTATTTGEQYTVFKFNLDTKQLSTSNLPLKFALQCPAPGSVFFNNSTAIIADGNFKLIHLETGQILKEFKRLENCEEEAIKAIVWDSKHFIGVTREKSGYTIDGKEPETWRIILWNIETGIYLMFDDDTRTHATEIKKLFKMNKDRLLSFSEKLVCLWDTNNGKLLSKVKYRNGFDDIAVMPDNKYMAACTPFGLAIWGIDPVRTPKFLPDTKASQAVCITNDGRLVAFTNGVLEMRQFAVEEQKVSQTPKLG